MLIDITDKEYLTVRTNKSRRDEKVVDLTTAIVKAFGKRVLGKLSGGEVAAFLYLLTISICRGQLAREVTLKEFESGIRDDEDSDADIGTGKSRPTVRASLRSLCDSNLINIYRKPEHDGAENTSRIYEINFTAMLNGGEIERILRGKSAFLVARNLQVPENNFTPLHTSNIVTFMENNGDTSISFLAGSSLPDESHAKGVVAVPFVGKKKTTAPAPLGYASGAEAIAAVQARHRATQATRVAATASAAPSEIPRQDMQALFDKHSTALTIGYRLMVTQREYGFLKKRLKENPPKDFSDMVRWSLTYWGTLAAQQRVSVRKDLGRKVVRKSLPEAPHFSTFVYWYPYFLKSYQNHLSGQTLVEHAMAVADDKSERTIRALQARVQMAEKGTQILRRRLASRESPVATRPLPLPSQIPRKEDDLGPDEFPEWNDTNAAQVRKKA